MTKTSILCVTAALTVIGAPAAAQTTKNIFVDVNFGGQFASRTFVVEGVQEVYGENAIFSTSHEVGSSDLFDISGGYRVWRDLSIGLGYSYFGSSGDATLTAAVPHPLVHDRRAVTTVTAPDLKRTEKAVHLQFLWTVPVTDKIDASFIVGPSFISAKQDLVNNISVPANTQDAIPVLETQSDWATGFHIGADLSYL